MDLTSYQTLFTPSVQVFDNTTFEIKILEFLVLKRNLNLITCLVDQIASNERFGDVNLGFNFELGALTHSILIHVNVHYFAYGFPKIFTVNLIHHAQRDIVHLNPHQLLTKDNLLWGETSNVVGKVE